MCNRVIGTLSEALGVDSSRLRPMRREDYLARLELIITARDEHRGAFTSGGVC